jgi:hypothetical protein
MSVESQLEQGPRTPDGDGGSYQSGDIAYPFSSTHELIVAILGGLRLEIMRAAADGIS